MARVSRRPKGYTDRKKSPVQPKASILPVVFHSGLRFVLHENFVESAAYRAHRRRMEGLGSFEEVMAALERVSKRLEHASKIDNEASMNEAQDRLRSRTKGTALYRRLCVAYDLSHRVPYALRFLNTL